MTEVEWLDGTDPAGMMEYLRRKASERKMRLFACACSRQFWSRLEDHRSRRAIEVAEQFADGLAHPTVLLAAFRACWDDERRTLRFQDAWQVAAARTTYWRTTFASPGVIFGGFEAARTAYQVSGEGVEPLSLLSDIVGNPFRPITIFPAILAWNDGLVVRLARAAYDDRCLPEGTLHGGRLAILADALEEAGCTDAEVLGHLRGPNPHVRGCWVLDLILGKA